MLNGRISWARVTAQGIPPLFVIRPRGGGFTPPNIGDEYPAPNPADKRETQRARQMYEQKHIGTEQETVRLLSRIETEQGELHGSQS